MQANLPDSKSKILEAAIPLFANAGFHGVSIRSLATAVDLNPATLYHHFQDKNTLYMAAISHAFARRAETLSDALCADAPPEQRLTKFAVAFCRLIHDDPDFNMLIQREILAGDRKRLQLLAEQVFRDFFTSLLSLCRELDPDSDSHMLAISIVGLMAYHYQITPLRRHLLGSLPGHNSPEEVARHVVHLLLRGEKGREILSGCLREEKKQREPLSRAISFLAQDIQNVADRILRPYDLTLEQLYVMQCLAEVDDGYTQKDICRRTMKTPANVTRILDRLENKSMVFRKKSPLDRRAYIVALTGRGQFLLQEANEVMTDFSSIICSGIDLESQDITKKALDAICHNVKSMPVKGIIDRSYSHVRPGDDE